MNIVANKISDIKITLCCFVFSDLRIQKNNNAIISYTGTELIEEKYFGI